MHALVLSLALTAPLPSDRIPDRPAAEPIPFGLVVGMFGEKESSLLVVTWEVRVDPDCGVLLYRLIALDHADEFGLWVDEKELRRWIGK